MAWVQLCEQYGEKKTRQERNHKGVCVPTTLLVPLKEALDATVFPSGAARARKNLNIDGYLTVARPETTAHSQSSKQAKIQRNYDRYTLTLTQPQLGCFVALLLCCLHHVSSQRLNQR